MNRGLANALLALLALAGCGPADSPSALPGSATGIRFLAEGAEEGFSRAFAPREFVFPADHGAHPEFRSEWWYFTGNLFTETERHFGFELTFFRVALTPSASARASDWATNHVWMAHFGLTDTENERFVADERLSRGAAGLAGAVATPFRLWVEDWSITMSGDGVLGLRAKSSEAELDLRLTGLDRIVRQGQEGLDRKGPEPGNASYYYSAPRLAATGAIRSGRDETESVDGLVWMDREWGTSALSEGLAGWDWFALQLDDGRDLMYYRLRNDDGSQSAFSGGSLTDAQGRTRRLAPGDVELMVLGEWQSPLTRVTYPVEWRLDVPSEQLRLRVTPRLRSQEMNLSVRYWEGAVGASGFSAGEPVSGMGYLELAGY